MFTTISGIRALLAALVPCVTSADLTTLSELMKEVYDPVIQDQQNLEAMTWKEFGEADDTLGGDGWFFETKMGGNQEGIGARAERDDLPSAGRQRWKQGKVYWKLVYGTFEITGPAIEAAKDNLRAFANARTEEIQGLTKDTIKDLNRQAYGNGLGNLAVETSDAANAITVSNGQYLRLNMMIDIWASAGTGAVTLQSGNRQITGLTANSDGTMTLSYAGDGGSDVSGTTAAGTTITRAYAAGVTGAKAALEIEGIGAIADDGTDVATYLNISRSSYPLWKGVRMFNSGTTRNLTTDLIQQAEDAIYQNTGMRPDWMRCNLGQRRKFFDLVQPDKRYMTGSIDGGYERLQYNGNTITVDVDHPFGEMTIGRKEFIKKYTLRRFGLLDFDGLVLRQVGSKDLWRGHIGFYGNLGCKRPNAWARLGDLIEPSRTQYVA